MSGLFFLSSEQLSRIEPYLPRPHGTPRMDDLRVISGIIYVLLNGLQWKDAPREYGPHKRLYNRFIRWSQLGVFSRICAELSADGITLDWLVIEATYLEAQRTAARLRKKGVSPSVSGARSKSEYIRLPKRYTTVGLEIELQDALKEIAVVKRCSMRALCTAVYDLKKPKQSFASALRIFIVEYYRSKYKSVLKSEVSQVLERIKGNPVGS